MTNATPPFAALTDDQLLARVKLLADQERHSTAALLAALAELDVRRLYLGEGCSSLFAYCTQALHLSEDAAYNRIRAARVSWKWPIVVGMIADGSVSVTAVRLLSDVLTDTNHEELLLAARHKSKRQIEDLIASLRPQPAVAPIIRKVATAPTAPVAVSVPLLDGTPPSVAERICAEGPPPFTSITTPASVAPLCTEHYKIQFTIPSATHHKLRRVQDLMRHTNPKGDPAVIFDRALTLLLERLVRAKLGKAQHPREPRGTRAGSRHVPAAVKREVWGRDGGQCAFIGAAGRCAETGFLEYHHVVPHAEGGEATSANIQLRCRAHNAYEAEAWFGTRVIPERHAACANWFRNG